MRWILPYFLYNEKDCLFYDEELLKQITSRRMDFLRKIGVPMEEVVFLTALADLRMRYGIPSECEIFILNKEIMNPWDAFRTAVVDDGPGALIDPHFPLMDENYLFDLVENGGKADLFVVERAPVHPFYLLQECGPGGGVDFLVPRLDNNGKIIIGRQQHSEIFTLSTSFCRFLSWTEGLKKIGSGSIPEGSWKLLPETRAFSLAHGMVDYHCIVEIEKQETFFDIIGDSFSIESLEKLYGKEIVG